jgi:hypothetical protein
VRSVSKREPPKVMGRIAGPSAWTAHECATTRQLFAVRPRIGERYFQTVSRFSMISK